MTRQPHCNLIDLSCWKCCSTVKITSQAARRSDHATNANTNSSQASEWSVLRLLIAGRARYSPTIRIHLKKTLVVFYLSRSTQVFNKSYDLVSFCTVSLFAKTSSKCIPLRNRLFRDSDRCGLQFFCENLGRWSRFQLLGSKRRRIRGGWRGRWPRLKLCIRLVDFGCGQCLNAR